MLGAAGYVNHRIADYGRNDSAHHCARHAASANPGSSAAPDALTTASIRNATSSAGSGVV